MILYQRLFTFFITCFFSVIVNANEIDGLIEKKSYQENISLTQSNVSKEVVGDQKEVERSNSNSDSVPESKKINDESIKNKKYDSSGYFFKMVFYLGFIILLIYMSSFLLRKTTLTKGLVNQYISVISVLSFGGKEKVALVNVDEVCLLIGITQHNISILHEFDAEKSEEIIKKDRDSKAGKNLNFPEAFSYLKDKMNFNKKN